MGLSTSTTTATQKENILVRPYFEDVNSTTVAEQSVQLIKHIRYKDLKTSSGFIRKFYNGNVPDIVTNLVALYSFLRIERWQTNDANIQIIDGLTAKRSVGGNFDQNVYGTAIASHGKHEWKIKVISRDDSISVGIVGENENEANRLNYNAIYLYTNTGSVYSKQTGHKAHQTYFGTNDTITLHLDTDKGNISMSINNKYIHESYMGDIDITCNYKLFACLSSGHRPNPGYYGMDANGQLIQPSCAMHMHYNGPCNHVDTIVELVSYRYF